MAKNEDERIWDFKCPNSKCGSRERVVQSVVDKDRAIGRLGEHVITGAVEVQEFPVADKRKTPRLGDEVSVVTI